MPKGRAESKKEWGMKLNCHDPLPLLSVASTRGFSLPEITHRKCSWTLLLIPSIRGFACAANSTHSTRSLPLLSHLLFSQALFPQASAASPNSAAHIRPHPQQTSRFRPPREHLRFRQRIAANLRQWAKHFLSNYQIGRASCRERV